MYDSTERFSNWQSGGAVTTQSPEQIYQTCYNLYNYGKTATESLNYLIENGYDINQVLEVLYNQYSDFWCEESEGWCIRLENLYLGREEEEFTPFGSFEDFAYQADRFGFNDCATAADMKTLYRKLARQFHPDLGGSESDMQELNVAYEWALSLV